MKARPFDDALLRELAAAHGTPLFVYRAETILERLAELRAAFDTVRYAQKANPCLAILALLRRAGAKVDAVSLGEILGALHAGFAEREIVFTADLFDRATLAFLAERDVPVNAGSIDMLAQYAAVRPGASVTLRVNPGFGHGHDAKVATGGERSKHGIWHETLSSAVARARELGLEVRGLHVHLGSGSSRPELERGSAAMVELAREIGPSLRSISAGGGLPIPYRAGEPRFDVAAYARTWRAAQEKIERELDVALELEVEPGRYLVAECGVLLSEVRATKRSGALDYVLVDAGFHNLPRPAMYGAYHQISAVGHAPGAGTPRVVAGPLCESADVFTQSKGGALDPQPLPELRPGDLVCIHDAGAYAMSMASHYNSQPLAAEVLVEGGVPRLVRRRQTLEELLASEPGISD
jgi:diaminopimelate decarboxylase